MIEYTVNYWAIIVAAIAAMAIGMLWHGPALGNLWIKLSKITPKQMKSMPLTPAQAMIGGSLNALVIAYVLSVLVDVFGAIDLHGALIVGFWAWLLSATIQIGGFLWEGKSFQLFLFNTGYTIVTYAVMSAIVTLWV